MCSLNQNIISSQPVSDPPLVNQTRALNATSGCFLNISRDGDCSHIKTAFPKICISPCRVWVSQPAVHCSALRTQIWVTAGHLIVTGPQKPLTGNLAPGVAGGIGYANPWPWVRLSISPLG